jgi:hypothetical protein
MVVEHAWTGHLQQAVLGATGRIVVHERISPDVALAALEESGSPQEVGTAEATHVQAMADADASRSRPHGSYAPLTNPAKVDLSEVHEQLGALRGNAQRRCGT